MCRFDPKSPWQDVFTRVMPPQQPVAHVWPPVPWAAAASQTGARLNLRFDDEQFSVLLVRRRRNKS